ncbi:hypothetical protein GW17_00054171 [Ensete ventricosum]|nr:hypothetical protein GW17_00054171 [Ensete ventricosum]
MVDFDCHRPILAGISRGREKEEEGEEKPESSSPTGDFFSPCEEKKHLPTCFTMVLEVGVTLQDGREFEGTVVNADFVSDIAVVKIQSKIPLPAAKLGMSSKLHQGDFVIAVGCPHALKNTITSGIVRKVAQPWIGLNMLDLNELKIAQCKDKDASCPNVRTHIVPVVSIVTPASPADRAGFRPGDTVIQFHGKPVRDIKEVLPLRF